MERRSRLEACRPTVREARRQQRVFAGEVLIFAPGQPFSELLERALTLVHAHLGAVPSLAHRLFPRERFLEQVLALQASFSADEAVRCAWFETLAALGMSAAVFGDQRFLRVLPPADGPRAGRIAPLHPHRDTWGSQVMQQENWWAPVMPVSDQSTLALYPRYWDEPIPSDAQWWSFDEYRRRRRETGDAVDIGYASAPAPLAAVPPEEAVPLRLRPGELAVFSGAHLHASMPNRSGLTRFSFETRTVVLTARGTLPEGAMNVDGRSDAPRFDWFRNARGRTLASELTSGDTS